MKSLIISHVLLSIIPYWHDMSDFYSKSISHQINNISVDPFDRKQILVIARNCDQRLMLMYN